MWSHYKVSYNRVVSCLVLALAEKLEVTVPDDSTKWGINGWYGVAVLSGAKAKIVVDLSVPIDRQLPYIRRPAVPEGRG